MTQPSTHSLFLPVRGMAPVPNNVEPKTQVRLDNWRRFIVQKARPRKGEFQPVTRSTLLTIEMIFVFLQGNVTRPDLDNLVKPVLDALFKPHASRGENPDRASVLSDEVKDAQVFVLHLRKRVASPMEQEGVDITISWE
jgi:Holliday junction resolvase RusA-like endonuclease